jgi:hypothetical protein
VKFYHYTSIMDVELYARRVNLLVLLRRLRCV